jgi:hypothetical protein
MAHQKETPPEGGATDVEAVGLELGQHLTEEMQRWAKRRGTKTVDAPVPFIALYGMLTWCLAKFPPDKRQVYADRFIEQLRRWLRKKGN